MKRWDRLLGLTEVEKIGGLILSHFYHLRGGGGGRSLPPTLPTARRQNIRKRHGLLLWLTEEEEGDEGNKLRYLLTENKGENVGFKSIASLITTM